MSLGPAAQATLTGGADHWTYQYGSFYGSGLTQTNNVSMYPAYAYTSQYANSGYFAQAQLGFSEALFVTAGVRAEDNQKFRARLRPLVGAAGGCVVCPDSGRCDRQGSGVVWQSDQAAVCRLRKRGRVCVQ